MTLLLVLLALQDPEPPKPQPKHKISPKLSIEEKDGLWRFRVKGTTDLPDGTVLKLRAFALELVTIMGESRKDEEGLSYTRERWYTLAKVKDGAFDEVLFSSPRKPFSLEYRGRAYYEKEHQDEALAAKIGDEDFTGEQDIVFGDPKNIDAELSASAKDIAADLELVQKLFVELKNTFARHRETYDPAAWKTWKKGWWEQVAKLKAKNETRWELWAAWVERQGRFRLSDFYSMFEYLVDEECSKFLDEKDERALAQAQRTLGSFMDHYEQARELVGLDAPFELERVGQQSRRYAKAAAALRALVESKDAGRWSREGPALAAAAKEAILQLASQKLVPRRGYSHVVRVADSFARLLPLAEDAAAGRGLDAWKKNADEHDAAWKAFVDYAQVKLEQ